MTTETGVVEVPPSANGDYTEANTQVLRDAAHIRKRPDNYIPDTSVRGLHHLAYELVYNAVDEHLVGYCKHIQVTIHLDGSLSVSDDGRGIPVGRHPTENRSNLEVVLTVVGAGGKFDNKAYKTSAGLHGMGAKAVTALSELTRAEVRRDGRTYAMEFERGKIVGELQDIGAADHTGTKITFCPDIEIFGDARFDFETLQNRLRELAFLNRGLKITIKDERTNTEEIFCFDGGVAQYVTWLNQSEVSLHNPIYIYREVDVDAPGDSGEKNHVKVEVALQYTNGDQERIRCYANNQYNPNGGTHLIGFRKALSRTLNNYGEKEGLFKNDLKPEGKDFGDGLTAVINVTLPNPQFESQVKVRLNNPEIDGVVNSAVGDILATYLEENPKEAKRIIQKVILAAEIREAEAKARRAVRDRKSILSGGGLPGKLMDCTSRDRDTSELFLVEGDSAGGSAESGRDRNYQAVLPLRGKVLNVEKARLEHLLNNNEIISMIAAIGTDIGNPDDISKLRYGKIVILTDADVDGQHIRALLLTFFFRQMRKLIEAGNIYVARPPLFKVTHKKQVRFVQTNEEMTAELFQRALAGTTLVVHDLAQPRSFAQDRLAMLIEILNRLELSLTILERRGFTLASFLAHTKDGGLPMWHVKHAGHEYWFHTNEDVIAFQQAESGRLGQELVVIDTDATSVTSAQAAEIRFAAEEFHEVRSVNRALQKLAEFGFTLSDLVPAPRIAGREPVLRFSLDYGNSQMPLSDLRDLVLKMREIGSKDLTITRFKGLGEMEPDELWETTLDPQKRTLMKVTLVDEDNASDLFRTLMGEEVEKRRSFIFEKGINVKDRIDYGS